VFALQEHILETHKIYNSTQTEEHCNISSHLDANYIHMS